jgi:tetratricopeptide (TPR) repeat protein
MRPEEPDVLEIPPRPRVPEREKPDKPAVPKNRKPRPDLGPLPGLPVPLADPKKESTEQIRLGKEAFLAGEYGRAESRFQRAVAAGPKEPLAYFLLAQARFALGKYQEAVAAIDDGLRVQPLWPIMGFRLRSLYGAHEAVLIDQRRQLTDALALFPNDPVLVFLNGYQLWFDDQRQEAVRFFERAHQIAPDPRLVDLFLQPMLPFLMMPLLV